MKRFFIKKVIDISELNAMLLSDFDIKINDIEVTEGSLSELVMKQYNCERPPADVLIDNCEQFYLKKFFLCKGNATLKKDWMIIHISWAAMGDSIRYLSDFNDINHQLYYDIVDQQNLEANFIVTSHGKQFGNKKFINHFKSVMSLSESFYGLDEMYINKFKEKIKDECLRKLTSLNYICSSRCFFNKDVDNNCNTSAKERKCIYRKSM